ncbi:MAG: hypothetical protein ACYCZG_08865 [Thiobacillus sp.]
MYLAEMSAAERAFVEKQNAQKEEWKKRWFSPEAKAKLKAELAETDSKATVAADTSIAKAKAAGVDTRVFGVPLGEPIRLPRCATANERKIESNDPYNALKGVDLLGAFRGVQTSTTCQSEGSVMAFLGQLLGGKPADRYIMLAKDSCPDWAYCEVAATLHEGNLAGVTVFVQKGASDEYVGKRLRAKYGKPTHKEAAQYQNQYGARYEVDEMEWELPGLYVKLLPGADGGGLVLIMTETVRKDLERQGAAQEARQPKL